MRFTAKKMAATRRAGATRWSLFWGSLLAMCSVDASAKIDLSPTISVRQVFADGVSANGASVYTVISPGIAASIDGQRASAYLGYSYDRRLAWQSNGGGIQKGRHSLTARGDMEVAQDLLYLSAGGIITSLNRDRRGPISLNPDLNFQNQTHVFSGYITPSIRQRFGTFADAELSYTLRGLATNDDQIFNLTPRGGTDFDFRLPPESDSYGHDVSLAFTSGENFRRFRWTLTNSFSHDRRDILNEVFRSYQTVLDGEFVLSRSLSLLGSVGYSDQRVTSDTSFTNTTRFVTYDDSGVTFDGGLRWSPSRRTDVSLRMGRRYGSTTVNANGTWQPIQGIGLNLSYNDTIDTFGRLFTSQIGGVSVSQLQYGGGFGNNRNRVGVFDLIGLDPVTGLPFVFGAQSINNATTRARSGQIGVTIDRAKWSGNVAFFLDRRRLLSFTPLPGQPPVDPRVFVNNDENYGITTGLERKVSSRASWILGATVVRSRYALSNNRTDWLYGGNLGYRHRLSEKVSADVSLSHTSRDSNVSGQNDSNSSLTFGLRAAF
jgi:uncharacterized protein (PEP-CTERM system associated)